MKQSLTRKEVESVLREGKKSVSNAVRIIYKKCDDARAGCVILIPKKTVKRSADRNKLRRRIRGMVRGVTISSNHFVILCGGTSTPLNVIKEDVEQAMKKIQQ